MSCERSSIHSIPGSVMIVWLKITIIFSEYYYKVIFSIVIFVIQHIFHFRCTTILNQYTSQCPIVTEYLVIWTQVIQWWNTQYKLYICATTMPVTSLSDSQYASPLLLTICDIWIAICLMPGQCTWILIWLIRCPPNGAKNNNKVCNSTIGIVLSPIQNLSVTGCSLTFNDCNRVMQQYYPLLHQQTGY